MAYIKREYIVGYFDDEVTAAQAVNWKCKQKHHYKCRKF